MPPVNSVPDPRLRDLLALGQSVWYDNLRRGMLDSGELAALRDAGVRGVTSNPSIFEKAIAGSPDYDETIQTLAGSGAAPGAILDALMVEDIRRAADLFRPVYDESDGADGFVSLEVGPKAAHDRDATLAEARRLWAAVDRPNLMIKVPGTPEGTAAVERLIADGIHVNVTLLFSVENYRTVAEAYLRGLETRLAADRPVRGVASVASFFVSRVDTAVDAWLDGLIARADADARAELESLRGRAAVANARAAYRAFRDIFSGARWARLATAGARAQRVLWASTGVKDPRYRDVLYVEELIGPDTVNTVPPPTLAAFRDHGRPRASLLEDGAAADAALSRLAALGLDLEAVHRRLQEEGVAAFGKAHEALARCVAARREAVRLGRRRTPPQRLGNLAGARAEILARWGRERVAEKIWAHNAGLWPADQAGAKEIRERFGWLEAPEAMDERAAELMAFAREARQDGLTRALLVGMGGSSLCPEVSRAAFGPVQRGGLALTVLDSTDPAAVARAAADHPVRETLVIVSTKSGTTGETASLEAHFWARAQAALGPDAGSRFVAVTDPGTPLAVRGAARRYRRVFLNPPDIGGRYSALSFFGLVPAALMGLDMPAALDRALRMAHACAPCVPADQNPGLILGAALAACAAAGRDKVTFLCAPSVASFGLWAEQLLAESTGKVGKGLVPVAGEPAGEPAVYGPDRVFVVLQDGSAPDPRLDAAAARLSDAGHPVLPFSLMDRSDLWGEYFRWEFATAAAAVALGINPFDQPDVESAKIRTRAVLNSLSSGGHASGGQAGAPARPDDPDEAAERFRGRLDAIRPGEYVAILAYLPQDRAVEGRLGELRLSVRDRTRAAVTLGLGPRYLHSTGQLHKGGPNSGVFLVLTAEPADDVPIPGQSYTFGQLYLAQALGDRETLEAAGRRVTHVHLRGRAPEALDRLRTHLTGTR